MTNGQRPLPYPPSCCGGGRGIRGVEVGGGGGEGVNN